MVYYKSMKTLGRVTQDWSLAEYRTDEGLIVYITVTGETMSALGYG